MANLLERLKQLMPVTSPQNELHENDERTVKHEAVLLNTVTKEGSAMLEPISINRSFVNPQSTPVLSDTVLSCNSSISSGDTGSLEPLSVWAAIQGAIRESLEIMRENKQLLAWLEYRSPSRGWVSSDPVSATRDQLEQLIQAVAALEPDALCVAIRGAVSLHPDINPARQGSRQGVSQLARFSRRAVNA